MQISFISNPLNKLSIKHDNQFQQNYYISPILIRLVYPLIKYLVLPAYFGKIKITGQNRIPISGPVIIAPTHRSRWDSIMVPNAIGRLVSGRDLRFLVSSTEMKGFQGEIIRRLGGFPVDLERPSISSFRHSIEVLANQEMLTIFPEGGIFHDDALHPLKEGLARIALQVEANYPGIGVKILPVNLRYSDVFPTWKTNVSVDIGEPLLVTDYQEGNIREAAKKLTAALATSLEDFVTRQANEN